MNIYFEKVFQLSLLLEVLGEYETGTLLVLMNLSDEKKKALRKGTSHAILDF